MANEDFTSKVPHYTFAETLEEQEEQLKTNPLMQRLNDYRKTYEGDPHRPIYHYINPEAMLNDPNGLCFWAGTVASFLSGISTRRYTPALGTRR